MPDHTDAEELALNAAFPGLPYGMPLDEARRRIRAAIAALTEAGLLLPTDGETREEWGVWWHGLTADGICLSEEHLRSKEEAEKRGHERIGDYGIRGFTTVRRIHIRYETGDWSSCWERVGETIWVVTP